MDSNNLTQMSRQAVTDAQAIARRRNHTEVDTWHLLSALLGQENGIIPGLIDKMGLSASGLQLAVERELEKVPKVTGSVDTSKVYVTQAVNDTLTRAEKESKALKDDFVSVEHLFLALIDLGRPEALKKLYKSFGLDRSKVMAALKEVPFGCYYGGVDTTPLFVARHFSSPANVRRTPNSQTQVASRRQP